jgi:hypothetical protein
MFSSSFHKINFNMIKILIKQFDVCSELGYLQGYANTSVCCTNRFYMNRSIFWDVLPCSLLEVHWCGGTYYLLLSGRKGKLSKQAAWRSSRWRNYIHLKHSWTSDILHGITIQKIILFTVTSARTSNWTKSGCQIWGPHSGHYKDYDLQGCNVK